MITKENDLIVENRRQIKIIFYFFFQLTQLKLEASCSVSKEATPSDTWSPNLTIEKNQCQASCFQFTKICLYEIKHQFSGTNRSRHVWARMHKRTLKSTSRHRICRVQLRLPDWSMRVRVNLIRLYSARSPSPVLPVCVETT